MLRFGRVDCSARRVVIAGSGPSLESLVGLGQMPGVSVIAVNGAVEHVRSDHFFTLDPSPENRRRMRDPVAGVRYWAAVPPEYGTPHAKTGAMREPADQHVTYLRRMTGDGPLGALHGLSTNAGQINTGNSAWGALQLAVLMGARRIVLIGVDGGGPYFRGGGETRDLGHLPSLFASAVSQFRRRDVEVANAGADSAITCFPRMPWEEAQRWIYQQVKD